MEQLLDYLAQTNEPYLHAKGEIATEHLIEWIDCQPNEKILEFGTGTGGTLVKIVSRYNTTKFWGVDASKLMIDKTKKRLKFCRILNSVVLKEIDNNYLEFFSDNYFDKIYVESVLGIQNDKAINEIINTFNRILKPSGMLLINETIWLDCTTVETINQFNRLARKKFGIIQASAAYPYLRDWQDLLISKGFGISKVKSVDSLESIKMKLNISEFMSIIFTKLGFIYGKLFLMDASTKFRNNLSKEYPNAQLMEGYLIMAIKIRSLDND